MEFSHTQNAMTTTSLARQTIYMTNNKCFDPADSKVILALTSKSQLLNFQGSHSSIDWPVRLLST